jgi:TRAP transporter TAXI family solute receptor
LNSSRYPLITVTVILLTLALLVLTLPGCSAADRVEKISIYTGGVTGTYYPLGEALAGIINNKVAGVEAAAISSAGSVENARAVAEKTAGLALVQNDIADYAYRGREMFLGRPVSNIRGIASWYPETVQFVTLKESGIKTINDLKGLWIAVGTPGSGTRVEAMSILNSIGINSQNTIMRELDFNEVTASLQDATIDAGCIVAGIPTPAVVELAGSREVSILETTDDSFNTINKQYPFFTRQIIPSGTYRGLDKDVQTVAVLSMLVTGADVPEKTIYNVTRAMFENLDALVAGHTRARDINLDTALVGMTIPLHPGAQKYYREKGLLK